MATTKFKDTSGNIWIFGPTSIIHGTPKPMVVALEIQDKIRKSLTERNKEEVKLEVEKFYKNIPDNATRIHAKTDFGNSIMEGIFWIVPNE